MTASGLQLFLFAIDDVLLAESLEAGVDGVVVDWESAGKHRRQLGANTEINAQTLADLRRVRSLTSGPVLCRVNGPAADGLAQIRLAIDHGADEILLPMVRTADEVERALVAVGGQAGLGVLIETADAVRNARDICSLPLTRVYVGLNDLAIDRHTRSIFSALADGTVDAVRSSVDRRMPFGVAGVTDPEEGDPLPCRHLIAELVRLGAGFTFLRWSFRRHSAERGVAETLARIRCAFEVARSREVAEVVSQREELIAAVRAIDDRSSLVGIG